MEDLLIAILQGLFEFALEVLARGGDRGYEELVRLSGAVIG
jgi:hypothetical protein